VVAPGTGRKIRVLLAEDHILVRQGFRRILEDDPSVTVVGEARTGLEAIELCKTLKPEVVVMDLSMPELGGLEATAEILKRDPGVKILILSMYSNDAYIRKALDLDLNRAVKALAEGEAYFSPAISHVVLESMKAGSFRETPPEPYERLTLREKEVLQLIAEGKSNKEIAVLLNISVNTVAVHRASIMETLGFHRTAELVLYAVKKGLVQAE
jgi:DNA-binding NarL/FixJ family response regulator